MSNQKKGAGQEIQAENIQKSLESQLRSCCQQQCLRQVLGHARWVLECCKLLDTRPGRLWRVVYITIYFFFQSKQPSKAKPCARTPNFENKWKAPWLVHFCKMMHGKFRLCRLKERGVWAEAWNNLQRRHVYLGRSHRWPHVGAISGKTEKQCPSLTCFLLPEFLWWLKYDWQ